MRFAIRPRESLTMNPGIRRRPANSFWQRVRRRWRTWRGAMLAKSHHVEIVTLGGVDFKRVQFAESATAGLVAGHLEGLEPTGCVPSLVLHEGREVWVEYVVGRPPDPQILQGREQLIDFFVALYRCPGVHQSVLPERFHSALLRDLVFLGQTGVLTTELQQSCVDLAERVRPQSAWLGLDYIDPLTKNFIVRGGRAIAIDIEALTGPVPLGQGLAKARLRWPFDPVKAVLDRLADKGGVRLHEQMDWVELSFLASYFRQKILQGKPGHIRMNALEQLVERLTR